MIIPQFDQDIATIKALEIQHRNGYHISEKDYTQFLDAIIAVNQLYANVKLIETYAPSEAVAKEA